MRLFGLIILVLIYNGFISVAWSQNVKVSPSFDCSNTLTAIEQAICNNNRIAKLDVQLSDLYKTARKVSEPATQSNLKNTQREWLKQRNKSCSSDLKNQTTIEDCIELHYLRRIVELWDMAPKEEQVETEKTKIDAVQENPTNTINNQGVNHSYGDYQKLSKLIMREGYIATEGNRAPIEPKAAKLAHTALQTALECSKRLNNASNTKYKICHNYDQDISPIEIEFSNGEKLCASVVVQGAGLPKTIVTSDSQIGSVAFENDIIAITYPARSSDREFFYNFKRDKGYSILGGVMRTDFTFCEDLN